MKDQQIIDLIRGGKHSQAIGELYRHFPAVRSFVANNGGSPEEARDIFQESLLILCKNALKPNFQLSCNPGTYLFSCARFLWKDELTKKNRQDNLSGSEENLPDLSKDIFAVQEEAARTRHLDQILAQVGEKCLKLLKMYYFERLSMKRIAQAFGLSSDKSAKTQKYKCLERARKLARQAQSTASTTSPSQISTPN